MGFDYRAILTPGGAAAGFNDLVGTLAKIPQERAKIQMAQTAQQEQTGFRRQSMANEYEKILMQRNAQNHTQKYQDAMLGETGRYHDALLGSREKMAGDRNDTTIKAAEIGAGARTDAAGISAGARTATAGKKPTRYQSWRAAFVNKNNTLPAINPQTGKPSMVQTVVPGDPAYDAQLKMAAKAAGFDPDKEAAMEAQQAAQPTPEDPAAPVDNTVEAAPVDPTSPAGGTDLEGLHQRVNAYLQQVPEAQRDAAMAEINQMSPEQTAAELDALGL